MIKIITSVVVPRMLCDGFFRIHRIFFMRLTKKTTKIITFYPNYVEVQNKNFDVLSWHDGMMVLEIPLFDISFL
jgi:hypothetical protein